MSTVRAALAAARAAGRAVAGRVRRVRFPVVFYNLEVSRPVEQVALEIRVLLGDRPAVLGLCEATGYKLPEIAGYRLLRDIATKSRANIAAYVRDDLPLRLVRWHDLEQTWSRTQHAGIHEPRSFLEFLVGRVQVIVGHQGPRFTDNTPAVQAEGVDLVVRRMAPWLTAGWSRRSEASRAAAKQRPRVLIWDGNRTARDPDGVGPATVAHRIVGWVIGSSIDNAVVCGDVKTAGPAEYRSEVRSVRLKSDHKRALFFTLTIPARWLRAPKKKGSAR